MILDIGLIIIAIIIFFVFLCLTIHADNKYKWVLVCLFMFISSLTAVVLYSLLNMNSTYFLSNNNIVNDKEVNFFEKVDNINPKDDLFSYVCKPEQECSQFGKNLKISLITNQCSDSNFKIKEFRVLPLFLNKFRARNNSYYEVSTSSEPLSFLKYSIQNYSKEQFYSIIKVIPEDKNIKAVYYASGIPVSTLNGFKVIFDDKNKAIIEGKEPDIMEMPQLNIYNLVSQATVSFCREQEEKNEIKTEWINSKLN